MSNLSPEPGVAQTPDKALGSALLGALVAFGAFYVGDDDPFTKKEIIQGIILAVGASGLTGIPTYLIKNRRK